jgi:hypothetical protein
VSVDVGKKPGLPWCACSFKMDSRHGGRCWMDEGAEENSFTSEG